jgi:hypothetical protein
MVESDWFGVGSINLVESESESTDIEYNGAKYCKLYYTVLHLVIYEK